MPRAAKRLPRTNRKPKAAAQAKAAQAAQSAQVGGLKIAYDALVRARQKPTVPSPGIVVEGPVGPGIFKPYQPAPGVVPKNFAMDSAATDQAAALNAWAWTAAYSAFAEGVTFMGYPYLAELTQRPEYRVMAEIIATEMTRKWIRIKSKADEADKSSKIDQLEKEFSRLKVRDAFYKMAELDGFFGRAHLYMDFGVDDDNRDELMASIGDGTEESKPKIKKGSLKRIVPVEPMWTYPMQYNANNPLAPDWYKPQSWFVMGKQIHATRLLTFVGREVPDILKPAYAFGGLSLSQMAKPYVDNWLNTRQSVQDMIRAYSVMVLKTDMASIFSGTASNDIFVRADMFTQMRDNHNLMMLDMNREDFNNVSASLSTLDQLQAQAQEHMAAVSRIPLVKLLGITPSGLNASSDGEIRVFYDTILSYQEKFFSPRLDVLFRFIQLSLFGNVDDDIVYEYEPLWALDEKSEAEIRKIEADTHDVYVNQGTISNREVRKAVADDPNSPYQGLDVDELPEPPEPEQDEDMLDDKDENGKTEDDFKEDA